MAFVVFALLKVCIVYRKLSFILCGTGWREQNLSFLYENISYDWKWSNSTESSQSMDLNFMLSTPLRVVIPMNYSQNIQFAYEISKTTLPISQTMLVTQKESKHAMKSMKLIQSCLYL